MSAAWCWMAQTAWHRGCLPGSLARHESPLLRTNSPAAASWMFLLEHVHQTPTTVGRDPRVPATRENLVVRLCPWTPTPRQRWDRCHGHLVVGTRSDRRFRRVMGPDPQSISMCSGPRPIAAEDCRSVCARQDSRRSAMAEAKSKDREARCHHLHGRGLRLQMRGYHRECCRPTAPHVSGRYRRLGAPLRR